MRIVAETTFRWCFNCIKSDKCRKADCCLIHFERYGKRSPADLRRDEAKRLLGLEGV
jgi:hypothetical protein